VRLDGEKIRASRRVARDAPRGTRARDEIERARIGDGDVARRRCDARDAVMRDARRRARDGARWIWMWKYVGVVRDALRGRRPRVGACVARGRTFDPRTLLSDPKLTLARSCQG